MRLVNLLLTLVSVTAAGSAKAQSAPGSTDLSTRKFRMVVIGSSTAAGQGAYPADSAWVNRYHAWLQQINPENDVLNLALGGFSTYQLLPSNFFPATSGVELPRFLTRNLPSLLFFCRLQFSVSALFVSLNRVFGNSSDS